MGSLLISEGASGLWRWSCLACGVADHRSYLTRDEAFASGRLHAREAHPEELSDGLDQRVELDGRPPLATA